MRPRVTFVLRALAAVAALTLVATPASAGCLLEYDACLSCAQSLLWEGTRLPSASEIRDANLYLVGCSIDLWRCMIYDSHHQYRCAL